MNRIFPLLVFCFLALGLNAQIVWTDPAFPTVDDDVTIYYDATQGSGELEGVQPVFMHTGAITESGGPGSWQFVQGNWGTFDNNVLMIPEGNDIHSKTINIRDFYGIPQEETVTELAFVFRNQDGSLEGKTEDYQDIFIPIYEENIGLIVTFTTPGEETVLAEDGEQIPVTVSTSTDADITIELNGSQIAASTGQATSLNTTIDVMGDGQQEVVAFATSGGNTVSDTFNIIVNPPLTISEPPPGTKNGINKIDANTVRLQLWAPYKDYVYVIGDFNDWQPDLNYFMKRSSDASTWWLDITGLDPNTEYAFQYFVDGELRIADPYSEKVLDQWNDPWIPEETYPNLKPYPLSKTTGIVTAFQTQEPAFNWQHDNFNLPAEEDMVVYELLVRDFINRHDYQTLMDSLDYLENLGINVIELMPVNEFEGNDSWGYNPSFHMALDKYYGTKNAFKAFIDECHSRDIAVVVDVVYNHAFSQSPLAQLYWDDVNFRPAPENPWLNVTPAHPFNVGSDFDHESIATQEWLDQVMTYWIEEYHLDGFRFDLSKGFTQSFTTDVGVWGQYNAARINLLKRAADVIWGVNPDFYVILEHFSDAAEERELADYGMLIWGNGNHEFTEAAMGYTSFLSAIDYAVGWRDMNGPTLVGYAESHDEERMVYKSLEFGNSGSGYDIQELNTALERSELAGVFLYAVPGPKMIWQFGELGYDYPINYCPDGTINEDCRTAAKPIRWDYFQNPNRRKVYDVWAAMAHLKTSYDAFGTTDYNYTLSNKLKRVTLNHGNGDAIVVGNFDVQANDIQPFFTHTGTWYEYFTGEELNVADTNMSINLPAGGYAVYTDQFVQNPNFNVNTEEPEWVQTFSVSPSPSGGDLNISLQTDKVRDIRISVVDAMGKHVMDLYNGNQNQISLSESLNSEVPAGIYFITLSTDQGTWSRKWVKL